MFTVKSCSGLNFVTRKAWRARNGTEILPTIPAVSHVFIHHTTGGQCSTKSKCSSFVRGFQNYHMDTKKWSDIGYSFLIGGDGNVYEGRGWSLQGAHTYGYNRNGIGVALIGDFTTVDAPSIMTTIAKQLIACGVRMGKIKSTYKLHGHRDGVRTTTCPGDKLYNEVKTWPNYATIS